MAKRIKFIISRIFPSFQSCRSQDPSTLPENPVPITTNFIKPNIPLPVISFRSQPDTKYVTYNATAADAEDDAGSPEDFRWKKEEKWHVISRVPDENAPIQKILNSLVSDNFDRTCETPSPIVPERERKKKKQRNKKKKRPKRRARISTSSAESGWFSSEADNDDNDDDNNDDDNNDNEEQEQEDEGTETLVSSSRTLSTDSLSSMDTQLETIRETPMKFSRRKRRNARRLRRVKYCAPRISANSAGNAAAPSPEGGRTGSQSVVGTVSPVRLSVFGWLVPCALEGKVRESFAVVKKSEDPYEDFKRSMVEMIMEKQMVEPKDLEQLLQCFLSLNSRNHHGIIVEAFSEICEALFCESTAEKLLF